MPHENSISALLNIHIHDNEKRNKANEIILSNLIDAIAGPAIHFGGSAKLKKVGRRVERVPPVIRVTWANGETEPVLSQRLEYLRPKIYKRLEEQLTTLEMPSTSISPIVESFKKTTEAASGRAKSHYLHDHSEQQKERRDERSWTTRCNEEGRKAQQARDAAKRVKNVENAEAEDQAEEARRLQADRDYNSLGPSW